MRPHPLTFRGESDLRLVADAWGNDTGLPVLLLHGGGQTRHAWGGTARSLAERGYRAICVDARGHGESDWSPTGDYQREHFARDLRAIVASLDDSPAIVGASLGGIAAMFAVGALGVLARTLVLVDIAPKMEPQGVKRILDFMRAHPDGFANLEEAADAVADYLPHRRRPDDVGGLNKNLRLGDDGRYHWHWDPAFLSISQRRIDSKQALAEEAARNIAVPTLLVRGKLSDLLTDDGVQHFLELVPHAEYVDVSGAAHMVAGDANDRFSRAVIDFLTRVAPPKT